MGGMQGGKGGGYDMCVAAKIGVEAEHDRRDSVVEDYHRKGRGTM